MGTDHTQINADDTFDRTSLSALTIFHQIIVITTPGGGKIAYILLCSTRHYKIIKNGIIKCYSFNINYNKGFISPYTP